MRKHRVENKMMDTQRPKINLDELVRRIRKEVDLRDVRQATGPTHHSEDAGSFERDPTFRLPPYPESPVSLPRAPESAGDLALKAEYSVAEFLVYHDVDFVRTAYRCILRREPDTDGFSHYLNLLRSERMSKAELLGRMRYSPEGKARAVRVHGLILHFALHTAYRIPVLGYGLSLGNFVVRLPAIVRNLKRFEEQTMRRQGEQTLQLNAFVSEVERLVTRVQRELGERDAQLSNVLSNSIATITGVNRAISGKADTLHVEALAEKSAAQIRGLARTLETKVDIGQLADLERRKADSKALADVESRIEQSLGRKAQAEQLEANVARSSRQIQELTQEIQERKQEIQEEKQEIQQQKQEIQELTQALDSKAGGEELRQLTTKVADVEKRKADAAETVLITTGLAEAMADKATVAQLEAHVVHWRDSIKQVFQGLATKADDIALQAETGEIRRQIIEHTRDILDEQRRIGVLLEEARKHMPRPGALDPTSEHDPRLDDFYARFEDRFRGTREDIKQRVAIYLPLMNETGAGTGDAKILDIGCGRGEWLELLRENGLSAQGVDVNQVMVSRCLQLGLEVAEADGIGYLRDMPSNVLGAITGMHIIEHIPFKRLVELFDEALRVLKPGGVAIFETPNPENLVVGACDFYIDPTHLNPLPPEPMRFVMEARGFDRIEVMRLHPGAAPVTLNEDATQTELLVNHYVFGAQDYALVAYKSLESG